MLLNVLADGIHRAHQRCLRDGECDPNQKKVRCQRHVPRLSCIRNELQQKDTT